MPALKVILYQTDDSQVPLLDWLDTLTDRAKVKCFVRIERLGQLGHELRRPEADYLRDGIYELRASLEGRHYRILYFFYGRTTVIISHGVIKKQVVPLREIALAIERKRKFEADPKRYTSEKQLWSKAKNN